MRSNEYHLETQLLGQAAMVKQKKPIAEIIGFFLAAIGLGMALPLQALQSLSTT